MSQVLSVFKSVCVKLQRFGIELIVMITCCDQTKSSHIDAGDCGSTGA